MATSLESGGTVTTTTASKEADTATKAPQWSARGPPFYATDPRHPQSLHRINTPHVAYVEHVQELSMQPVDLPVKVARPGKAVRAYAPAARKGVAHRNIFSDIEAFEDLWNGVMSARRTIASTTLDECRGMLASEQAELTAHAQGKPSADNSLPPRQFGVMLLIPLGLGSSQEVLKVLDAFAALSDTIPSWVPQWEEHKEYKPSMCSAIRFSVHSGKQGELAAEAERALRSEAMDHTQWDKCSNAISVALRWGVSIEADTWESSGDAAEPAVRMRCERLPITAKQTKQFGLNGENAAQTLKGLINELATQWQLELPLDFDMPTPMPNPGYFEAQVVHAANEMHDTLYREIPFLPNEAMQFANVTHLHPLHGYHVRIFRDGIQNAANDSVLQGLLLCAGDDIRVKELADGNARYGFTDHLFRNRNLGLLHTAASSVAPVALDKRVSFYGIGNGKPGMPIQRNKSTVWVMYTAVKSIEETIHGGNWVLPCDSASCLPKDTIYTDGMKAYMKRLTAFVQKLFPIAGVTDMASQSLPSPEMVRCYRDMGAKEKKRSAADRFYEDAVKPPGLPTIGAKRNFVGETIVALRRVDAPSELVQLLQMAAARVNKPDATVQDAFVCAAEIIRTHEQMDTARRIECEEMKQKANDAMVNAAVCADKAVKAFKASHSGGGEQLTFDMVKELMHEIHSVSKSVKEPFRSNGMTTTPRPTELLRDLATFVRTALNGAVAPAEAPEDDQEMYDVARNIPDPLEMIREVVYTYAKALGDMRVFFSTRTEKNESNALYKLDMNSRALLPCDRFTVLKSIGTPFVMFVVKVFGKGVGVMINAVSHDAPKKKAAQKAAQKAAPKAAPKVITRVTLELKR